MDKANSFVGRTNSFVGGRENGPEPPLKEIEGAVVVVDPFSTGAFLASEVRKRGVKCARVLSAWDSPVASLVAEGVTAIDFCATIQHNDRLEDQDLAISQVSCGLSYLHTFKPKFIFSVCILFPIDC